MLFPQTTVELAPSSPLGLDLMSPSQGGLPGLHYLKLQRPLMLSALLPALHSSIVLTLSSKLGIFTYLIYFLSPGECKLLGGRDFCLICSLWFPQLLGECLALSRCSVRTGWCWEHCPRPPDTRQECSPARGHTFRPASFSLQRTYGVIPCHLSSER